MTSKGGIVIIIGILALCFVIFFNSYEAVTNYSPTYTFTMQNGLTFTANTCYSGNSLNLESPGWNIYGVTFQNGTKMQYLTLGLTQVQNITGNADWYAYWEWSC